MSNLTNRYECAFLFQKFATHLLNVAEQTGSMSKLQCVVWGREMRWKQEGVPDDSDDDMEPQQEELV